mmetsp:Transcript_84704/g.146936  ORF Transcript_84704/g.146936 Transcript_84704/m.146936 type:complete len:133 (+) Transcript_84704:29-427(+)
MLTYMCMMARVHLYARPSGVTTTAKASQAEVDTGYVGSGLSDRLGEADMPPPLPVTVPALVPMPLRRPEGGLGNPGNELSNRLCPGRPVEEQEDGGVGSVREASHARCRDAAGVEADENSVGQSGLWQNTFG